MKLLYTFIMYICHNFVSYMGGWTGGGGGGVPNSVFNKKKFVLIRESISEISP